MSTMKQVAAAARVSVATVSRVINDSGYVSPPLRARVEAAMAALDYRPSALARGLRRQRSQTVGLLVPQIDQPFFGRLLFAIEKTLFAHRFRCFICSAEEDRAKEDAYLEMLLQQRVDGVILVPTGQNEAGIERLVQRQLPLVLVDRNFPSLRVDRVLSDNYHGAVLVTRHLLELGHRRLGLIAAPAYSEAINQRLQGVRAAARDADAELTQVVVNQVDPFEVGYSGALQLLAAEPRPSAIIALTDVIAVGVLHAAAELALSVPQALSVTGFDDIPLAHYSVPTLTTVAQPIYGMGETAARLLLERIAAPATPARTVVLDTQLVVRASTAAPGGPASGGPASGGPASGGPASGGPAPGGTS